MTLTGAGGTGKTRLALQAAQELADDFEDGVWFVPLAALTDPALVEATIAEAVGARGDLNVFLRGKRLLVLLDNLEQLMPAVAQTVGMLETSVLATSREWLNLTGEQEYPVPTLQLDDAVALFTERARRVEPRFEPDVHVPEIARRLDGLPLALELAAARVKALTPGQIVERLGQRLQLLTGGARDTEERQQTLRATIEWSYRLLDQPEQILFARLAVFVGGFTLAAAEYVADAELDRLQSLVAKNLVGYSEGRFQMLETIRELALEKLELSEEAEQATAPSRRVPARIADGRRRLVRPAALPTRPSRTTSAPRSTGRSTGSTPTLRLGWLSRNVRISHPELARWYDAAPALGDRAEPRLHGQALLEAASIHWRLGNYDRVDTLARQGLDLFRALGDDVGQSSALQRMAFAALARGEHDRARALLEQSLELAEAAGSSSERCVALHNLGELERGAGNLDRSAALLEEALQLALDAGSTAHAAAIEHGLGDTALAAGETAAAERHYLCALSRVGQPILDGVLSRRARERGGEAWRVRTRGSPLGSLGVFPARIRPHVASA